MDYIRSVIESGVMHISMDRTDKQNAITIAMYEEMSRLLESAAADEAISCVLISGDDGLFTAGNDLKDFLQAPPSGDGDGVIAFLHILATFPKPLGAAVGGLAVGIGVTLLFHCDFAVAGTNASFSAPFVNLVDRI